LHGAAILLHGAAILLHGAAILLHGAAILLPGAAILLHGAAILLHEHISRESVEEACSLGFVAKGHNLLLRRPSGVGKTIGARDRRLERATRALHDQQQRTEPLTRPRPSRRGRSSQARVAAGLKARRAAAAKPSATPAMTPVAV
jgi:hypothetical protein